MHHDTSVSSLPDSKVDSLTGRKPAKMEDTRRQSGTEPQLPGRSQSHITYSLANDEKLMVQLVLYPSRASLLLFILSSTWRRTWVISRPLLKPTQVFPNGF
jgi:hypothetical protein